MSITHATNPTDAVLGVYAAVAAGDPGSAAPHLAEGAVLHVPGSQPLSGDHVGREAVIAMITASSTLADRTESVEVLDLLVGAEHVAALCSVTGRREDRVALENRTIHLFRIEDGLVAEIWFHNWDQGAVDAFWS